MTITSIGVPFGFTLVSPAAPSASAPLTIAGGGKAAVQLRFDGTAGLPGAVKAGQLTIASDDTDEFPFAVNVQASVIPPLAIIDNGNAGFASSAGFLAFGLQGYADPADNLSDVHYAAGDGSGDAATWTFDLAALGLPNGESYSVAATWTAFANRATNATFEIYDGAVLKSSAALNQELSPNDFSDQGVSWEELGGVRITSGTLVVKLTDAANEFVIADAVRIEQSTLPEIEVEVGGTVLDDDVSVLNFGITAEGVPVTQTVNVTNVGAGTLDLDALTLSPGFTASNFAASQLASGESASFDITYDAAALGVTNGQATLDNNDGNGDEAPFDIALIGEVSATGSFVIDDSQSGDPRYDRGGFQEFRGQGFENDVHFAPRNHPGDATYSFGILPGGVYDVSATWSAFSNRATNAPYTISGPTLAGGSITVGVNQQVAPNDFSDQGVFWNRLANFVELTAAGPLTITLNGIGANGYVISDGVRADLITDPEISVQAGGGELNSDDAVALGAFFEEAAGSTSDQVITIQNVGVGDLLVDSVSISGDAAFTLNPDPDPIATITSLGTADFTVSLATDTPGDYSATVTINSNDLDEGSFSFSVTASVTNLAMVDDGDPGFSANDPTVPSRWTRFVGQGVNNDVTFRAPAGGNIFAAWNVPNLTDGMYNVYTTWTTHSNRSQAAPYTVFDGGNGATQIGDVAVNQETNPDNGAGASFTDADGVQWRAIASAVAVSSGEVTVQMGAALDDYVIADAVLVERLSPLHAEGAARTETDTASLSDADVEQLFDAAVSHWTVSDPSAAARLENVGVHLSDLPGNVLGLASPVSGNIWIDISAAGQGWYVDAAPETQKEFFTQHATGNRVDLLTVMSHELGHVLGLSDLEHGADSLEVMTGSLPVGARRLPTAGDLNLLTRSAVDERGRSELTDLFFGDFGQNTFAPHSRTGVDRIISLDERNIRSTELAVRDVIEAEIALEAEDELELLDSRRDDEAVADELFAELFAEGEDQL
ncbi:MAG: choice-of-anchor D domain-containing protein [Pirellulales bacterium]